MFHDEKLQEGYERGGEAVTLQTSLKKFYGGIAKLKTTKS
jgi:hypothetical protein